MKKLLKVCFLLMASISTAAHAIVSIENMRVQSADRIEGMDANVSLDVAGKNGNTKNVKAGLGGRIQQYSATGTWFALLNYEYGESSNTKDTNNTLLHLRKIWYTTESYDWEMFAQFEENEFTRLNSRTLLGGGVRFNLLKSEYESIDFGAGLFRSKEELDLVALTSDVGVVYNNRLNLYLVYKLAISSHSRLSSTLYYQPDINDTADYRLLEQFGLQLDIAENLFFNLSVNIAHDSRSPQLIKATDTTYNTGFEYRFK